MLCGRSWKYQRLEANSSKIEALKLLGDADFFLNQRS